MNSVYWNVALFDFGRISYRCIFVARSNIDVRMYTKRVANAVLTVVEIMSRKYGCGEFHKTNEQPTEGRTSLKDTLDTLWRKSPHNLGAGCAVIVCLFYCKGRSWG